MDRLGKAAMELPRDDSQRAVITAEIEIRISRLTGILAQETEREPNDD